MRRLVYLILFWLPAVTNAFAQQPPEKAFRPVGQFLEDSMRIGDTVRFALTYRHPSAQEVVFPDTAWKAGHFELLHKRYFPTKTTGSWSLDSTIYVLRSFELSPVQRLSMPVFLLRHGDSSLVYSNTDSVGLQQLVAQLPEELKLAENAVPLMIEQQFNYPYLIIGLAVGLLLVLLLVLIFGKAIRRRYERYMSQTKFKAFQSRFENLIRRFERSESVQTMEEAVTLWKNYLTDLEDRPINSFTTKEIAEFYSREELSEVLKLCDRAIYGNIIEKRQETTAALRLLKQFSVDRYTFIQLQTLTPEPDAVRATA